VTKSVASRARRIALLVVDVDGVLTDGRMTLSDQGGELKSFHTRDGIGFDLARRAGLELAMVTGETSPIAKARGAKLGVAEVVLGARRKGEVVEQLLAERGLSPAALAFVGDDLLDIPALERAGLAIAVADAAPEVKAAAHLVTRARGGQGAVRECVEVILKSQGRWRGVVDAFVREHGGRGDTGRPRRSVASRPRRSAAASSRRSARRP
jgi:3-deoxy-D-manno-octulosonate 8-phosphate phosphatase (KDO 8-P phosphatase)